MSNVTRRFSPSRLVICVVANGLLVGTTAPLRAQSTSDEACERTLQLPFTGASQLSADVLRIAEIRGSVRGTGLRALRRGADEEKISTCELAMPGLATMQTVAQAVEQGERSWRLLPVQLRSIANSKYPVDRANGAMRGGKGLSAGLEVGATIRWGPVTAKAAPFIGYETNGDFAIFDSTFSNRSRFANPWISGIDWPQRFGEESTEILDAGETFLRADFGPVGFGVSHEILVWGGARRYPILLGDAAPGFTHVFLGLNRPVDLKIGSFDLQLVSATLTESDFFNDDPADDDRRFSGLFAAFQPGGVEGLTLGVGATLDTDSDGNQSALDLLSNPLQFGDNPDGNAIYSFFFRWILPLSGFELYAEWARDDATRDIEDFVGEIDHSSAWTAGFQNTNESAWGLVRVGFEMTDLKARQTTVNSRSGLRFYTHGKVTQGHTNDGQLLGSWTGPGSDAQYLQVDLFRTSTRYGAFVERVRRDDDTYERFFARDFGFRGHDAEITGGVRFSATRGAVVFNGTASVGHRKNRSFLGLKLGTFDFLRENNVFFDLSVSWWPRGLRAWKPF
jgi:Capsule assembly protein Wzi